MNKPALRCATYIRVSTEEQHLEGLSLPAQKKALVDYANTQGYTIVGHYADEGISARKPMRYRKGLMSLLEDVKKDKIDMILVTKLDRWFRNIKDYNITEDILKAHHCYWKTIFENYDSSTANGQMVINIMLSVNQAECDRTSERIKAVFDYKKSAGLVISGMHAPYGYRVEQGKLIKDAEVSDIVDEAFRYYFTCYSKRQTRLHLQNMYGDRCPSVYKIERLFSSEKYAGCWEDNPNFCPPYITRQQYQSIQDITQRKIYPKRAYDYVFSGLIVCPVCGHTLTGFTKRQKLRSGGVSLYPRYRCADKFNSHPSPCVSESVVESYMTDHVILELHEQFARIRVANSTPRQSSPIPRLRAELDRLNTMFQKGRITEDFYDQEYVRLEKEIQEAESYQSYAIERRLSELSGIFSGNWLELYNKLDNIHKSAFWKSTIKDIQCDPETHKICGFHFLI